MHKHAQDILAKEGQLDRYIHRRNTPKANGFFYNRLIVNCAIVTAHDEIQSYSHNEITKLQHRPWIIVQRVCMS